MAERAKPGGAIFAMLFVAASLALLSRIGAQTVWSPGAAISAQPRLWPAIGLAMMVGFGALHLLGQRGATRAGAWAEALMWLRALEYVGWFIAYVFLVPLLGYLPASLLFAGALAWRLGLRAPRWIAACLALALCVVVAFRTLLHVHVPGGALYHAAPAPLSRFLLTWF